MSNKTIAELTKVLAQSSCPLAFGIVPASTFVDGDYYVVTFWEQQEGWSDDMTKGYGTLVPAASGSSRKFKSIDTAVRVIRNMGYRNAIVVL